MFAEYRILFCSCQSSLGYTYNTSCRCVLLQTSAVTTVTSFLFLMVYCCMTNLSACTVSTANNLSINDNSTANSSSKSYKNYILRTCSCTFPCFSQSCYISIISSFRCKACQLCQFLCNCLKSPIKIYCTRHFASFINRTRNTNAYTVNVFFFHLALCDLIQNSLRNIRNDRFTVILFAGRNLPFLNQNSVCLKESTFYRCTANINSKTILSHDILQIAILIFFYYLSSRFLARFA